MRKLATPTFIKRHDSSAAAAETATAAAPATVTAAETATAVAAATETATELARARFSPTPALPGPPQRSRAAQNIKTLTRKMQLFGSGPKQPMWLVPRVGIEPTTRGFQGRVMGLWQHSQASIGLRS